MPNNLVDRILDLGTDATASERLILKLAAALVKQLDRENYDLREDDDPRIKLVGEEFEWIPDGFEVVNGIPRPKYWAIPERMALVEPKNREIDELTKQFNGDRTAAWNEYCRLLNERRRK
ncbi:MAG: hypothetical protein ACJ746_19680 [Bryobacteraceae bacterium]